MGQRDDLIAKWQEKLDRGEHDEVMDVGSLRPDSFCVVFDMCWGGPACGGASLLAPEYFDSPADFVAWLRAVELPRSLHMMCGGDDAAHPKAEGYSDLLGSDLRPLLETVISAADACLAAPDVDADAAQAVITAFNDLFGRRDDAQFVASGGVGAVLRADRIREHVLLLDEDGNSDYEEDEPPRPFMRLVEEGRFDVRDPEQFAQARQLLAGFPAF